MEALAAWMDDPARVVHDDTADARSASAPGRHRSGGRWRTAPLSFFGNVRGAPVPESWARWDRRRPFAPRVRVPAFITAGWYDVILGHDLEHFARMRATRRHPEARDETPPADRSVVARHVPNVVGELDFGRRAAGVARHGRRISPTIIEWFRSKLGGRTRLAEGPRVRLFVQGVNRWRDEDDWPVAGALYPASGTCAATAACRRKRPPPTKATTRSSTTRSTRAPRAAAISRSHPTFRPGRWTRRRSSGGATCSSTRRTCWSRDVEVIGPVTAGCSRPTSGVSTDFVVKLCDVTKTAARSTCATASCAPIRTMASGPRRAVDMWGDRDRVPRRSSHPRDRVVERLPALRTQSEYWREPLGGHGVRTRTPARVPRRRAARPCVVLPVMG